MAKKFFETPVVKISNFQTKDVIAASNAGDFSDDAILDPDAAKARVGAPSAGTIKKSGLTW